MSLNPKPQPSTTSRRCSRCGGQGYIFNKDYRCYKCNGAGWIEPKKRKPVQEPQ
jgi:DnaJ-class molecular chaperone